MYRTCGLVQYSMSADICFATIAVIYGTKPPLPFWLEGYTDCPTDLLAFLLVIYLALTEPSIYHHQSPTVPNLSRTIVQDATYYFLVIFTSHTLVWFTLIFGRVGITLSSLSSFSHSPRPL